MQHWFTVDDLMHLYRGGRVNAMSAMVGGALGIKPILHVDAEGRLIPAAKVRGRRAALRFLADRMAELQTEENDPALPVFIGHADAPGDAGTLAKMIRERFVGRPVEIGPIGPVIGSHAGPGTITLFFLGERR